MRQIMKSATRGVLVAVVGSAFIAGCGGVSEQSPSDVGQTGRALASPYPGQVYFTGAATGSTVVKVGAGNSNAFAWTSDGQRWGWGLNNFGQVGTGSTASISYTAPTALQSSLSSVVSYDGGKAFFSATLTSGGNILTFGYNTYGQLGNGTTTNNSTAQSVFSNAQAVAAGTTHTLALKNDGTVWGWGQNSSGETGNGTFLSPQTTPVQASVSGVTFTAIAAGNERSYAVDSSQNVWVWGYQTFSNGDPASSPQQVSGLSSVVAIDAGEFAALALKSDGTVWQLGLRGALSQVTGLPAIASVAVGGGHFLAVAQNGTLWSWGSNDSGQLGDGTTTNRTTPVQVVRSSTPGDYLTGVVAVAAGASTSYAVLSDGTLWSWGSDSLGGLGR